METKRLLIEDEESGPDVAAAAEKKIFSKIFTKLYNRRDKEGRRYSDSMAELPEHDIIKGKK